MRWLAALLPLTVFGCQAPQSETPAPEPEAAAALQEPAQGEVTGTNEADESGESGETLGDGEQKYGGRVKEPFQLDDDFDIFDEGETEAPSEAFTQEILDERVAEILPRVAELRGLEFERAVPAGMQSADEFIEFALEDFEREYGLEAFAETAESYRLLGLIEPDLDLLATTMDLLHSQVGGYYDPRTGSFYMIDTFGQGALADIILAHELTHALDDQYYDLQAMFADAKNADHEFAIRSVIEGSGTSLMNLYAVRGALEGWMNLEGLLDMNMLEEQAEALEFAPAYLVMTLMLPYLEGNKLLTRKSNLLEASIAQPDFDDVHRLFLQPPLSSEQVLHFEKYWDPEQLDEPTAVELDDHASVLGSGWSLQESNTLGELGCFVITAKHLPNLADPVDQMTAKWTNEAATGWDGDQYQSYRGPNQARVLLWESVWDSTQDAQEFALAMRREVMAKNDFMQAVFWVGDRVRVYYANPAGRARLAELQKALGDME